MLERYSSCCILVYIAEVGRSLVYEPCLDIEKSADHEQPKEKKRKSKCRTLSDEPKKKRSNADKRSQSSIKHIECWLGLVVSVAIH